MIYFDLIDSTNLYAKKHFQKLADQELIVAGSQTDGHGQHGRKWISPSGNIYASFILKNVQSPFLGIIASSLATLSFVRFFCPDTEFYIKWPNDIYYSTFKIAGILSEFVSSPNISGLIVGIGVNIDMSETELAFIDTPAASIYSILHKRIDAKEILVDFEERLKIYAMKLRQEPDILFQQWKNENRLLHKDVDFLTANQTLKSGYFEDISNDGAALIRMEDGNLLKFLGGDIRLHIVS